MTVFLNGVQAVHTSLTKRSLTYVQASTSCSWGVSVAKWSIGYF